MIFFNFKTWPKAKILLAISVVFNVILVIVLFTGMQTQIIAQNERDQAILDKKEFEEVFNRTKTFDSCVQKISTYEVDTSNLKDQVVPYTPLMECFKTWHQM